MITMNRDITKILVLLVSLLLLSACSGDKTFNDYARAGDTVAVAAGWKQDFNRENITVTITPSSGPLIVIPAGAPAIRASINFYPDPLSSAIVSRETNIEMTPNAKLYAQVISANFTSDDKDWYQTTVFVDLPQTLPIGTTAIEISNAQGATVTSNVEIVEGIGAASTLTAENAQNLSLTMLNAFSRVQNYTIDFSGSVIPYAIEIILAHDPDSTVGGAGKAYAVNPLGYKKNLHWSDNGTNMKAMLMPVTNTIPENINDFKFYVTGNISNLSVFSVKAFDINGNNVENITATSTVRNQAL